MRWVCIVNASSAVSPGLSWINEFGVVVAIVVINGVYEMVRICTNVHIRTLEIIIIITEHQQLLSDGAWIIVEVSFQIAIILAARLFGNETWSMQRENETTLQRAPMRMIRFV